MFATPLCLALAVASLGPPGTTDAVAAPAQTSAMTASGGEVRAVPGLASCPGGPQGTLNIVNDIGGPYAHNYNPFSPTSNTYGQAGFVYESLLEFSLTKATWVEPWLATSYQWSQGGRALTLSLRRGVDWSDGTPFTSQDVVYTFDMLNKWPATNKLGIVFSSISAEGPYAVKILFPTPSYTELFYVGSQLIVPEHIWSTYPNPSTALNLDPVGTGPYEVKTLTSQTVILTPNAHYWQTGLPCIKTISAPTYTSNTTADLALEQGNGNWGGVFVAGIKRFTSEAGHVQWDPPIADISLYPNLAEAPLNSLPLRQAISDVLNRPKIAELGDLGELPPITNATGIILPRDSAQLAPQFAHDNYSINVAKAKAVLAAAGYTWSSAGVLLAPDKKAVAITIIAPSPYSDIVTASGEVISELKVLGIQGTENAVPLTEWINDVTTGEYELSFYWAGAAGPNSFYQYNEWFNSAYSAPVGKSAGSNDERFSSPKADALIKSYLGTNNASVQAQDMAGLESIEVNELPVIPVYYLADWAEYVDTGIVGWPSPSNPYETPCSYVEPMNEVVLLHLTAKG